MDLSWAETRLVLLITSSAVEGRCLVEEEVLLAHDIIIIVVCQ